MADDGAFSPAGEGLSVTIGIQLNMEGASENREELLEDDDEEEFEMETNDLDNVGDQVLEIKSNGLENVTELVPGVERNDLENDGEQILETDSEQVLEFESNEHESNSDQLLEIPSNYHDNNSDQMLGIPGKEYENDKDAHTANVDGQIDGLKGKFYVSPVVGMEFESYDDAYNYYNSYAKEVGFGIRVKSSWTKRNSKEKRGAVLCCNCEGFKTMKEANARRKETRTGCLAMIRLRLVESNRWRLDEVKLEHNHLFDPERAQNSKSHKKMDSGAKRKLESAVDVEVRTIKLYRTPAIDAVGYGSSNEREISNHIEQPKRLKLGKGDVRALYNYFSRVQLADLNFFYIMDLNDEGYVRNVFWIDSRSRAAYGYFGDVIVVDTTCLSNNYETPVLAFTGVNHHGQSVLMGCALLVDETMETYVWLLRAWLTSMSGRPPQTIITDHCKALQSAIAEVFPRAHHCLCLPLVIKGIHEKLGEVGRSEMFHTILNRMVYKSTKVEEFEIDWEEMIEHFAIRDHEWLQSLYEDRERWVPVYLKDTFFAGMFASQPGECMSSFPHGYAHKQTTWNEFFDMYESFQQKSIQKETLDDIESREFTPELRTSCSYELQLSDIYTKEIFLKFQDEVELMSSCFSVTQIHANLPVITYLVKDQDSKGDARDTRNFEVIYDKIGAEVRCICGCFNFRGYLCRHALCVLSYIAVNEVPSHYILSRWRKDLKRLYASDLGSNNIDITNPVQWFDHLHRRAMQVVAEGMTSQDHHMVAWQAFKESLNKVRLVADKRV
ncbi:FAR1-RELATED SEQUENCE 8-like isoform X1 [Olea europaea subsp. europaea]|uniref:Protein FAR1-RELATED SEQUENCE n=1 Tax=Olea europaea subsp. europaea TaxID=158383 RepID=A0A8S0SE53_OLEEU|nr:FAR1-RELATED SEQUENCE 8-like isoform X1 [Olea europaea subsp. europaea]